MRFFHILPVAMLMLVILPGVSGELVFSGIHWVPENAEEGDEIEIFVLIRDSEGSAIDSVKLEYSNTSIPIYPVDGEGDPINGSLYKTLISPGNERNIVFHFIGTDSYGTHWSSKEFNISIDQGNGTKEDTIFGLPRIYCSISIIFITLIIIFLTWSYFKGRRMQKDMEKKTGLLNVTCSECGSVIHPGEEKCRRCGAVLEEEEFICGKCNTVMSSGESRCPECGAKLRPLPEKKKVRKAADPDLEKIDSEIDMKGKVTCGKCGTVYMKKEKKCPQCKG